MLNLINRSSSLPQLLIKVSPEIPAQLTPCTSCNKYSDPSATLQIFPDSGASICLAGPQHLEKLRVSVSPDELIQCFKRVTAVGFQLICHGWLLVQFQIGTYSMKQPLYICNKVDRIYFSRLTSFQRHSHFQ